MRKAVLVTIGLALVLLPACAARGPSPRVVAELSRADQLVRAGCHACLREALSLYERLAALPRPSSAAARGAFETALLLSVREKELGLPWAASLDRARTLAAAVPALPPPAPSAADLLAAAEAVAGETSGLDPAERVVRREPWQSPEDAERRSLDAAVDSSLTAAYLALAIDCERTRLRDQARPDERAARFPYPIVRFRAALCASGAPLVGAAAAALREADPRFVDTLFFEARQQLVGSRERGVDLHAAESLLAEARAAFPASAAITLAWANANLSLAEFARAVEGFDAVLAGAPTHRTALLGRVTALSYALDHAPAIESASRLIELGTWHIGDAYYWRAWNRYHLKALEPAWADVEQAVKLLSNTSVYTLAGLIAYGRGDRPTAIARFDRAIAIDGANCDAAWMAAIVRVELQNWAEATPGFSRAMSCYTGAASAARAELASLEAAPRPESQKARPRARLQRTIETSDERAGQSAFNAAQGHLRHGRKGQALAHVDVAAAYPPLREKAAALRASIEKLPE